MPSRDETTFDHARAGSAYLGAGHSVSGGRFFGLLVLRTAVLSSATARGNNTDNLSRITGVELTTGLYIAQSLSGVAVTSGLVQLLKEPS